ncbi:MAG: hypothetical protein JW947_03060 [Sedimentisphaerales bacterium]|nr:hypothetical protein [Sedimentisphaerales bacterium]
MNKRQKAILTNTVTVLVITAIAVAAMVNLKNQINLSEAGRAMEGLSQAILQYRQKYGSVPPESYINRVREKLEGNIRLGEVIYRAQWINLDSTPNDILAYTAAPRSTWLQGKKYLVLRLDGRVDWMRKQEFDVLLAQQQSAQEIEMLRKKPKQEQFPPPVF